MPCGRRESIKKDVYIYIYLSYEVKGRREEKSDYSPWYTR